MLKQFSIDEMRSAKVRLRDVIGAFIKTTHQTILLSLKRSHTTTIVSMQQTFTH